MVLFRSSALGFRPCLSQAITVEVGVGVPLSSSVFRRAGSSQLYTVE